ncbi:hypothetical protein J1N35_040504, partial [Gossypium stocksii]
CNMPCGGVNLNVNFQEDGTSSTPHMPPHRVSIPDESFGPLMQAVIGVFQRIVGTNPTLAS